MYRGFAAFDLDECPDRRSSIAIVASCAANSSRYF
jgi:hypothetical protein